MIDEVDAELMRWIQGVVGAVSVQFEAPAKLEAASSASAATVSAYLSEIVRDPAPRDVRQTPARVGLRYVVSVSDKSVARAHALLGQLLLAALEDESQQVVFDALSPAYWSALGVEPRPAFVLQRPLARPKQPLQVPHATDVVARTAVLRPLIGQVLGPRDIPLAGARVELPGGSQAARTDAQGRFRIMYVPLQGAATSLKISAKGRQQLVQLDPDQAEKGPVLVRFSMNEQETVDARASREREMED